MSATSQPTSDESDNYEALYDEHSFGTHRTQNSLRAADVKQCDGCEHYYPASYGLDKDDSRYTVCSWRCHFLATAEALIRGVQFDHQYCAACYQRLKIVYAPGRKLHSSEVSGTNLLTDGFKTDIPGCAIGRAIPQPHVKADLSVLSGLGRDGDQWDFEEKPALRHSFACSCHGNTDHKDDYRLEAAGERDLPKAELVSLGNRLLEALAEREKRGKWTKPLAEQAFYDRLRKLKSEDSEQDGDDEAILIESLASAVALADDKYGRRLPEQ